MLAIAIIFATLAATSLVSTLAIVHIINRGHRPPSRKLSMLVFANLGLAIVSQLISIYQVVSTLLGEDRRSPLVF